MVAQTSTTAQQLEAIDPSLRADLVKAGFDAARLLRLAQSLPAQGKDRNRIQGLVRAPSPDEIPRAPEPNSDESRRLERIGRVAIARGELAVVVLAGGMATRMGGAVKALVEALPGMTFLDLRLGENVAWTEGASRPVPLWLMTSAATDAPIREALRSACAPRHVQAFSQQVGLRLTPEGGLFHDDAGRPSPYATGHGNLVDALRNSGLLDTFLASGGKTVWVANLDNLGASIDPSILGAFLDASSRGPNAARMMVEVCEKAPGDAGGVPVYAPTPRGERLQIVEEFRLPQGFPVESVNVFNTNTFLVDAAALRAAEVDWTWFAVEKKVDGRVAVQFERLVQELTTVLPTTYLRVPRDGDGTRFVPVKDHAALALRRPDIERLAHARGMISARSPSATARGGTS